MYTIGIRREDKTELERRAPLAPRHVRTLAQQHPIRFQVESSVNRVFPDNDYAAAGAEIVPELNDCDLIIGIKEVPENRLLAGKPYLIFSHTTKGQPYNMPLLKRILELKCTLLDYELVVDDSGQRLIFFGVQAGQAGMVNTLWSLGQRWKAMGHDTPFAELKQAREYDSLDDAREAVRAAGRKLHLEGLPPELAPLVCGIAGYGQVSRGAQEIFELLEPGLISADQVLDLDRGDIFQAGGAFMVVFKEEHMVERIDSSQLFNLQEYYDSPELYRANFKQYLPHLTMLANAIYWTPKYPRIVTFEDLEELFTAQNPPVLTVIGDITCDVGGSVESTVKATLPDNPVYVINPRTREVRDGFEGDGMLMMTVDILPSEVPRESTEAFGEMLSPLLPSLINLDPEKPLESTKELGPLQNAIIVYDGELTPGFKYLEERITG